MESLIISYSFFEPKSLHREMRTWDLYNNQDRYWYNIPALMAINSVVYPDAKIKVKPSSFNEKIHEELYPGYSSKDYVVSPDKLIRDREELTNG